ncbi:kynureninase [Vagococcus sp. DIV0080]|uniref:Kynureninase n=1 Tax=Candidatus Vagococcus giribetii TaxID=2230876 RepID=A0ABS3HVL3_9ENTE|nr:kynureninase [Vagococcus sp. DIV0080]MBO0477802.1 kynureninase [Vagococcus sp. DIV0080]
MSRTFETSLEYAKEQDKQDDLRKYRDLFYIQEDSIYMDGNSLGMASKPAVEKLDEMVNRWKNEGVIAWNDLYLYAEKIGSMMAPLVNADADEVTIVGSTTSNIHQALATFYQPTEKRYKIMVDDINFPTDRYAVDSIVRLKGYDVEEAVKVIKSPDGEFIDEEAIIAGMTDDVAVILLPTVLYRSAQIIDMKRLAEEAHKRGIYIGFDLCHAIGAIEMDFKEVQPDFAVWCTYKYLNGGFGSCAGLYINRKHFEMMPGLNGWFGNKNATQFQLKQEFEHEKNASGWQIGTPSVFNMAPLEGSLEVFNELGMPRIREKSLHITAYLMYLIDTKLKKFGYSYGNSTVDEKRGGHVCLQHDEAYRIAAALRDNGVVPDFREPNVIRLAPIALYTSYEEVYLVVEILEKIVKEKIYENYSAERTAVV